ncbi:MAG TPA: hypothetical protein DCP69_12850 [Candidatus Omnitrophica bacterium]|nr:hypothetical protein [Candidatus Omnitrophota bacterium]
MANRITYGEALVGRLGGLDKITARTDQHLTIDTATDSKNVRINSRNFPATTGDAIAVQIKPAVSVTKTADGLKGLEVSPRVNSGIAMAGASGTVIGIHADVYLKGTAAGAIGGDVRALNLELVTDDAGVRAITGEANAIRVRAAFSASITGKMIPIRIEKAETQTGSLQWDAVLDLPSTNGNIWTDAGVTSATTAGAIAVRVNGNRRYINLFSATPA